MYPPASQPLNFFFSLTTSFLQQHHSTPSSSLYNHVCNFFSFVWIKTLRKLPSYLFFLVFLKDFLCIFFLLSFSFNKTVLSPSDDTNIEDWWRDYYSCWSWYDMLIRWNLFTVSLTSCSKHLNSTSLTEKKNKKKKGDTDEYLPWACVIQFRCRSKPKKTMGCLPVLSTSVFF